METKFSEYLKEARLYRGYSQPNLAKISGINQTTISFWENGKGLPTMTNLMKLAVVLEVSTDYLCGLEKSPYEFRELSVKYY